MLTDRMWSWCLESEATWPALDPEGVRYVDERTCVAPVRLEPGRTYVIWFNTEQQDAFRDTKQRPAVPYRLEFATAGGGEGGS
jgi:RNA polymerase sigma-70 factor (ECF subfamily)